MAKIQLVVEIDERLYKNIIDNDKDDEEFEAMDVAFCDAKPLPRDATNGDIIKAMFPDVEVKEKNNVYEIYFGVGTCIQFFNHQWWNAPYKRGGEDADSD